MNSTPIATDGTFQSKVLKSLDDIKQICLQGEAKRVHFEARMQTQWDLFVTKMSQGNIVCGNEPQNEQNDDFEDIDRQFPKYTKGGAEELEMIIRQDFVFKSRLFGRMDELGGSKPNEAIRLRMKYLFSDKCLDHYTWRGTHEKAPFEKLTLLNDLIFKSVRRNFKGYSRRSFNKYMVEWLKHSTTRQRTVVYTYPNRNSPEKDNESDMEDQCDQFNENNYYLN
ncbi:hypothetical protein Bhyg_08142 [Pseudolycoriella hygida]|uniref:DUF4806 domain-containing protein n=1 Tax=Pseudolycoriella hygida TaxID=35572 RepID=A0A9Q0N4A4_9DIPT|nr:hypothetical protein Bhyg_08142 [Pseudolycoriella hygida]